MAKSFSQDMEEESVTRSSDEKGLENDYFEKEFEKCQICMILNLDDIFVAESKSDLKEHLFSEHGIVREKKTRQFTGKSLSEAFAEHGENMLCTKIVLNVRNHFCTQNVLPRFQLGIFMY